MMRIWKDYSRRGRKGQAKKQKPRAAVCGRENRLNLCRSLSQGSSRRFTLVVRGMHTMNVESALGGFREKHFSGTTRVQLKTTVLSALSLSRQELPQKLETLLIAFDENVGRIVG